MTEKPWLEKFDNGVLPHIQYPDMCLHEMFFLSAEKYQDKSCLYYEGREITYEEASSLVKDIAKALIEMGIQPGERIGLILPNIPEFMFAYYAVLAAGAVVVPLNIAYTVPELEKQVKRTQIRMIFGWKQRASDLEQLISPCNVKKIILCDGKFLEADNRKRITETNIQTPNVINFKDLKNFSPVNQKLPAIKNHREALFQFSGGTTGTPKAAVALHKNIIANVYQFRNWLISLKDGEEQFLTVIPLSHVYGMVIGLNVGIAMGATINLISDPRNTQKILETIQKREITFYPGVPAMYHAINQNEEVKSGKYDLRSVKVCISGSAPLLPQIREQFERSTGGKLVEGYGLSEAPTATHCNPILGENRNGSIGLPLPDVECKIVETEGLSGGVGELWIKGPQVMSHYHEEPEETKRAFSNGWLRTGDIARMDNDGYFYIIGRKKDLIKVGGLQVWPQEVEEAILLNAEVKEVVVAGVPDPEKGERIKAWVVVKDGQKITPELIKANCVKEIAHFKIPSRIEFLDEIPKTMVGKVLRRELVAREMEKRNRE
jgi:long-chain acyl-CoA synthetase